MKTLIAALLLVLGSSFSVIAAEVVDLPLRTNRVAAQQIYDILSDTNVDAKDVYVGLSTDLQTDLWILQLEHFLSAKPELTTEQYSVVAEAIGLLSTGIHGRQHASGDEASRAAASLEHLTHRIKGTFTRGEGVVFGRLGYSAVDAAVASLASRSGIDGPSEKESTRGIRSNAPAGPITSNADCECSTESDWCYETPTSPYNSCIAVRGQCAKTPAGCGTFWQYGCNGMCS
jgi:hypothetical protein